MRAVGNSVLTQTVALEIALLLWLPLVGRTFGQNSPCALATLWRSGRAQMAEHIEYAALVDECWNLETRKQLG